ncbi:beta-carotene 15,15'-monooxygenase [Streptococcus cristatus]|uniref:Beta-carotene 15,15'-monooxygenase n=1 Tax=Streptococcus cristatus TaxID=45634 RepID=A0A5B0DH90_STRCR|nr:TraX family protein [Streptococcus cristatus]KAA0964409.1 beta-carotene 15,15'-monooxygenase [Streptococcus cristatus]
MKTRGLNAFQLKLFMAFLMIFDHINKIPGLLPTGWDGIFHLLTRCVGAWFAFSAVEGFLHTRNRLAYNARLFIWAAIMQLGNSILTLLFQGKGIYLGNNIFLTLACGLLVLNLVFGFSNNSGAPKDEKRYLRLGGAVLVGLAGVLLTEGGMTIIPFMLLSYIFRNQPVLRTLSYIVLAFLLFCLSIEIYPTMGATISMMLYNSDWAFITVLPFLHLYNGERGYNGKWGKYFFYIFYPAHLWIIALIAYLVQR